MSDIVERLRDRINDSHMEAERMMDDAAVEIQSLRQRVERLEGALREANEKFEAIIGIASGYSLSHGDPGGGLEMIHAEACQGAGIALSAQFTAV